MTAAERTPASSFEARYRADPDPWRFATSAYEQGRYDSIITALGLRRYARGLELGASIGVLTERLVARCDALVAVEPAPTAAARLRAIDGVTVVEGEIPEDLPAGPFDLVVASEVLYYLGDTLLDAALDGIERALVPGGTLLAAHWTGRSPDHVQTGEAVHARLAGRPALTREHHAVHDGFVLDRFTCR